MSSAISQMCDVVEPLMDDIYNNQPVQVQQDFMANEMVIKKGPMVVRIPPWSGSGVSELGAALERVGCGTFEQGHMLRSVLRTGTRQNDINTLYGFGFTNPQSLYANQIAVAQMQQNAACNMRYQPKFPRSEQELDAIMMRRVNARLQLQQDKIFRHWKHIVIGTGIVIVAPMVIVAIFRFWGLALSWLAA